MYFFNIPFYFQSVKVFTISKCYVIILLEHVGNCPVTVSFHFKIYISLFDLWHREVPRIL